MTNIDKSYSGYIDAPRYEFFTVTSEDDAEKCDENEEERKDQ